MPTKSQLNLPPTLVKRLDEGHEARIQKLDMSLEEAKSRVGRAVKAAIRRSDASLKDFGDPSQVNRWTLGENPNVARLFQRADTRREFIRALAEEDGAARVRMSIDFDVERVG